MRILLLTDNHSPTGGAEKYFFELKDKLKKYQGNEVFSIGFGKHAERGTDYTVLPTTRSKWSKLFWQIFIHHRVYRELRLEIERFNPDVIHIHNVKQFSAAILKALSGYSVVQTVHDYGLVCPIAHNIHKNLEPCKSGFRFSCFWQHHLKFNLLTYVGMVCSFLLMQRRIKSTVSQFLAVSPMLANYLDKNNFTPATFIPPFKLADLPSPSNEVAPQHGNFLYAGHLGAHKGTHFLLHEFALAISKRPDIHLTIAGGGEEEIKLQTLARQLNLTNHVTFIGWQHHLDTLYQSHFAVIVPSLWMEAFGLIISEAMSHQRPVIGSNRGSIPWLIDDHQTGFIFDPTKKGDLAEKILQLADNPDTARTLGKNGYHKIHQLMNNDASLQKIMGIYKSIAEEKGAAAPLPSAITPTPTDP